MQTIVAFVLALVIMFAVACAVTGASIGGTTVPALDCAEDEMIGFVAVDTLGCVHHEKID